MSRARDLADSADKDIAGTLTADGLSVDGGTIKLDGNYPVGTNNVAMGDTALDSNVSGASNTAIGSGALTANTASNNTAIGKSALSANTTGTACVAVGVNAGADGNNDSNTFVGYAAGRQVIGGSNSTAIGRSAMEGSGAAVDGDNCTAVGFYSLYSNSTGDGNTAVGNNTLQSNTTGSNNTSIGYYSGFSLTTGYENTFIGRRAGVSATTGNNNTFVGQGTTDGAGAAITTGSRNTIIGGFNGNQDGFDIRTSNDNVIIATGGGNVVFAKASGVTRLPDAGGDATSDGATAVLRTDGRLQRSTSSRRYKTDIEDASFGLQDAMNLRPVTFKSINDGDRVFAGFIAEEVDEAGLDYFVQYNAEGQPETISYGNITSLCIKAIQELKAENDALKARVEALENA